MSTSKRQSDNSSTSSRRGRLLSSIFNLPPLRTLLPRPSNESNLRQEYIPLPPKQRMSKLTAQNKRNQMLPIDIQQILIDDFNCRKHAAMTFPPKISDFTT